MSDATAIRSREELVSALADVAEIEHGITCQYLYAAFSLKTHVEEGGLDWVAAERVRGWKAELLRIARQEMAHHGMVCNLLLAVGGAPRFRHVAFPYPVSVCPPYQAFELQPFSRAALERFACYERLHAASAGGDGVDTGADAGAGPGQTIGGLYRRIRHGLEHVARGNPKLFIGPGEHQIGNPELRIRPGQFDVDLARVVDLRSALALIDRLLSHDHHERFTAMLGELAALEQADPAFAPARPVASNPRIEPAGAGAGGAGTVLGHPITRAAAAIFDGAYELMLLMLGRIYGRTDETAAEVQGLIATAFFPLMTAVIRPLGECLTRMPVSRGAAATAGPCFGLPFDLPLPPFKRSAWVFVHERLQELAAACERLCADVERSGEPWTRHVASRLGLLGENLAGIAAGFERHMNLKQIYARHMLSRML
jgi:hypothetical protein